jgi:hypothetical protein
MNVVNSFFRQIGLSFRLAGVAREFNANWYNWAAYGSQQEFDMKRDRQGNIQALNIYSVGNIDQSGTLGYASFPWEYQGAPWKDGIIINHKTLTGGSLDGLNTGRFNRLPCTYFAYNSHQARFLFMRLGTGSDCSTPSRMDATAVILLTTLHLKLMKPLVAQLVVIPALVAGQIPVSYTILLSLDTLVNCDLSSKYDGLYY